LERSWDPPGIISFALLQRLRPFSVFILSLPVELFNTTSLILNDKAF